MRKKGKRPATKTPEWPFLEPTPPEVQLRYLRNCYEHGGPHINFERSIVSKVASEVFRKAALRKVN
jgi:hypothetical protein